VIPDISDGDVEISPTNLESRTLQSTIGRALRIITMPRTSRAPIITIERRFAEDRLDGSDLDKRRSLIC
jgi:hypothetical protein